LSDKLEDALVACQGEIAVITLIGDENHTITLGGHPSIEPLPANVMDALVSVCLGVIENCRTASARI
jgi:hypothetical protein